MFEFTPFHDMFIRVHLHLSVGNLIRFEFVNFNEKFTFLEKFSSMKLHIFFSKRIL